MSKNQNVFVVRHKSCDKPLAKETSMDDIARKVNDAEYWCVHCGQNIETMDEIEIEQYS